MAGRGTGTIKRALVIATAALAVLVAAAFVTAPVAVGPPATAPALPGGLDDHLAASEARIAATTPIIVGAEKRIRWHSGRQRTGYAVVYLHGFSATRQEIAPVAEMIAARLEANLFETRLAGHGLEVDALHDITAEAWMTDAVEALAIGTAIGDRLVVMGTSTGATLALAVTDHPLFAAVDTLVLMSPNFAPGDASAELLLKPGGPQLARLLVGGTRTWTPANDRQARYWTTSYPIEAVVEMMRLVERARSLMPMTVDAAVLTLYSPSDRVVNVERIVAATDLIRGRRNDVVTIDQTDDPGSHVLAGDILSPGNNETIAGAVVRFVDEDHL